MTPDLRAYLAFRAILVDPLERTTIDIGLCNLQANEPIECSFIDSVGSMILQSWLAGRFDIGAGTINVDDALTGTTSLPRFLAYQDILIVTDSGDELPIDQQAHLVLNPDQRVTLPKRALIMGLHRISVAMFPRPDMDEIARGLTAQEIEYLKPRVHFNAEGNLDLPVFDPASINLSNYFVRGVDGASTPDFNELVRKHYSKKD